MTKCFIKKCCSCKTDCIVNSQLVYDIIKDSDHFFCSKCVAPQQIKGKLGLIDREQITVLENSESPNFNPTTNCFSRVCPNCKCLVNYRGSKERSYYNCQRALKLNSLCIKCSRHSHSTEIPFDKKKQAYTRNCPTCNKTLYYQGKFAYGNCHDALTKGRTCFRCRPGTKWSEKRKQDLSKQRTGSRNPNFKTGEWVGYKLKYKKKKVPIEV